MLSLLGVSYAQTRVIGEVTTKTAEQITVKTDGGQTVAVPVTGTVKVLRLAPGETSLSKAETITIAEVNPGDRVLARQDQIIVMSRSDLQQKQAAEQADWQKRGLIAKVTAIQPGALSVTTGSGETVTVNTAANTVFRRYVPESIRFSDAKPSKFEDVRVGDQVRVLGNRSGAAMTAETVVSGSFRNFAATVISVDQTAQEVKLTDLATKKPITIKISAETILRRMPERMAQMMAQRSTESPAGAGAQPPTGVATPAGRGPRDFGQMLERMPPFNLPELKPEDAVIVASTEPGAAGALAIALVAGVEPLLTGPPADRRLSGQWSLDINVPQ